MRRDVAALSLLLLGSSPLRPVHAAGAPLPARCELAASGEYSCGRVAGEKLLVGAPIAAFAEGAWHIAHTTLRPVGAATPLAGSDRIGQFKGTRLDWMAGNSTPFQTSVKNYVSPPCVVFEYAFPDGAEGTAHAPRGQAESDVLTNFPAFRSIEMKHAISWADNFINFQPKLAYGPNGGPAVWFDSPGTESPVLIASPLDNFIGSSSTGVLANGDGAVWAGGMTATIESLPRGFSQSFVLYSGVGVTASLHEWGALLQRLANSSKIADPTLTGLSYQTDNGAQYCFCNEHCDSKLIAVREYLERIEVPVQLMSFQGGWWTNKNIHTPLCAPWCVTSWNPNASKVPMGLPAFHEKLGLPLQLYAPYFCADTVYDIENGGKWPFVASNTSLPGCGGYSFKNVAPDHARDFYDFFFAQGRAGGMVAFEPDFLQQNYQCLPAFNTNVSAMPTWLAGLNAAGMAVEPPVPIQFCMATPMELLASMALPTVTNFRASNDFYYGGSYKLGSSSLLIWAAGQKPSKDTFWTTDNSAYNNSCTFGETSDAPNTCGCPANGCPADHGNVTAGLHTLLAIMSTGEISSCHCSVCRGCKPNEHSSALFLAAGVRLKRVCWVLVVLHSGPVGFSDAIGQTNASLIRRTCNANGTLLKPSKPLTTIDRLVLLGEDSPDAPNVVASYDGKSYAVSSVLLLMCLIAIDSTLACLPACLPACPPACLPACLHAD